MSRDLHGAASNLRGKATKESFESTKKHINKFLESLDNDTITDLSDPDLGLLVQALPLTYDTLIKENVTWRLMDYFAGYLVNDARCLRGPAKALSMQSADNYLSAIKNGIVADLNDANKWNLVLLDDIAMKSIRAGMRKKFCQNAIDSNSDLTNPHMPSETDDILTVAICCIWAATSSLAGFLLYFCH